MFALRLGVSARFARWPVPENEHAKWTGVITVCRGGKRSSVSKVIRHA